MGRMMRRFLFAASASTQSRDAKTSSLYTPAQRHNPQYRQCMPVQDTSALRKQIAHEMRSATSQQPQCQYPGSLHTWLPAQPHAKARQEEVSQIW